MSEISKLHILMSLKDMQMKLQNVSDKEIDLTNEDINRNHVKDDLETILKSRLKKYDETKNNKIDQKELNDAIDAYQNNKKTYDIDGDGDLTLKDYILINKGIKLNRTELNKLPEAEHLDIDGEGGVSDDEISFLKSEKENVEKLLGKKGYEFKNGKITRTIEKEGKKYTYTYDENGNCTKKVVECGNKTTIVKFVERDEEGNATKKTVINKDGEKTETITYTKDTKTQKWKKDTTDTPVGNSNPQVENPDTPVEIDDTPVENPTPVENTDTPVENLDIPENTGTKVENPDTTVGQKTGVEKYEVKDDYSTTTVYKDNNGNVIRRVTKNNKNGKVINKIVVKDGIKTETSYVYKEGKKIQSTETVYDKYGNPTDITVTKSVFGNMSETIKTHYDYTYDDGDKIKSAKMKVTSNLIKSDTMNEPTNAKKVTTVENAEVKYTYKDGKLSQITREFKDENGKVYKKEITYIKIDPKTGERTENTVSFIKVKEEITKDDPNDNTLGGRITVGYRDAWRIDGYSQKQYYGNGQIKSETISEQPESTRIKSSSDYTALSGYYKKYYDENGNEIDPTENDEKLDKSEVDEAIEKSKKEHADDDDFEAGPNNGTVVPNHGPLTPSGKYYYNIQTDIGDPDFDGKPGVKFPEL